MEELMNGLQHEPAVAVEENWLVSIIVPVYNVENYLEECVRSVLEQTYRNFELLLVDDGSTDSSPALCDRFAGEDPRVRAIHKENTGVSSTRNRGIEEARGDFIMFVDSDDLIQPEMLRKMVYAMTRYQTDLAISGFERFRDDWVQHYRLSPYSLLILQGQMELASVYKKPNTNMFGVSIWAKMYRADIIREHHIRFQTDIDYEEDCCFNIDYFHHVSTAAVLRDYFYRYRQMEQSLSKGYRKNTFRFLINGYRRRIAYLEELGMAHGGADGILMIVIKTTVQKIFHSSLPLKEKLEEYAMVMGFEECREVCRMSEKAKVWLTRRLAKAVLSGDPRRVHSLLNFAKWGSFVKGKLRAVLSIPKRMVKKVLRRA